MSYSDIFIYRRPPKIPTPLFLIIIFSLSFLLIRFFGKQPLPSSAVKKNLQQIKVVNLSYNQSGIFWQTDIKEVGWLIYGDSQSRLDRIVYDEQDTSSQQHPRINHYVLIKDLKENQQYFFKIVSNQQIISDVNNQPFSFHTSADVTSSSNISPAYGKVISTNGNPLSNGAVLLSFDQSYPLFSLVKLSGEWLIPLNNIVNQSTAKPITLTNKMIGSIEIYDEEGHKSKIDVSFENLSPLPQTIIIGQNYQFDNTDNVLAVSDQLSHQSSTMIDIVYPKEDSIIPGERPLIKGTALPGSEVALIINSESSISTRIKTDSEGVWRFTPKQDLSPGKHTLTVITKNQKDEEVRLTRIFTIAKSGEQVLGDATAEPTLTTAPTNIPTPTQIVTVTSTPAPTIFQSGFNAVPFMLTSSSLIIVGLGIILAF